MRPSFIFTSLIIIPLFDRPFFPKMMVPILLSNEELVNNILESLSEKQKYVGLLFAEETEGEGGPSTAEGRRSSHHHERKRGGARRGDEQDGL